MLEIKMSFKFIDRNDDRDPYTNYYVTDSLIFDISAFNFNDENLDLFTKFKEILAKYNFICEREIHKNLVEYSSHAYSKYANCDNANLPELLRSKLNKICDELLYAGIDVLVDKYTDNYLDGGSAFIQIEYFGDDYENWIKNLNELYAGKYIYNPDNLKYDQYEEKLIEKGIITI